MSKKALQELLNILKVEQLLESSLTLKYVLENLTLKKEVMKRCQTFADMIKAKAIYIGTHCQQMCRNRTVCKSFAACFQSRGVLMDSIAFYLKKLKESAEVQTELL